VFAFDRGYSLNVLTQAVGGEFYDLAGPGTDLAFCPLREIDSDSDRIWAVGWIEALCRLNGQAVSPSQRNRIAEGVENLRISPTRSLTELRTNVQDEAVQAALQHYTLGGPLGQLLDAEADSLGSGRFLTFETDIFFSSMRRQFSRFCSICSGKSKSVWTARPRWFFSTKPGAI